MHNRTIAALVATALLSLMNAAAAQPLTIRAGIGIDGKGGVQRNAVIAIEGSKIAKLGDAGAYDFSRLTVLPGLIDRGTRWNG